MELKEFVKTVLKDVIEAVEESRDEIKGGKVSPEISHKGRTFILEIAQKYDYHVDTNSYFQNLEFDIAVTTESMAQSGGKAKVNVMGLVEVGGDSGKATTNTNVSRIKFHVPIAFSAKK